MLARLISSWIVSVLFVVLAERNNGYSSSLSHDEKIKRIREKRRRLEQETAEINPAKRNVLDLKNETCKNREKRNVLKFRTHDTLKQ